MRKPVLAVIAAIAVAGVGLGAWWWQRERSMVMPRLPAAASAAAVAAAPPPPPPASAASAGAIAYPVEPLAEEVAQKGVPDVATALNELFGSRSVLSMFQAQDFARRFVATVDNLARTHAPSQVWPMNPAAGRFTVEAQADGKAIAAANGARYTPYVVLIETLDLRRAVAWYARLYPQLQQAYENLGYPGRYFNDRFVQVIDHLLATPDLAAAVKVHLPVINGPVQPQRPWVLYEFDDPAFQALSSGQKILLRMGADNERRVKGRLAELRRLLAAGAVTR
jgi:Protein of unknown function (DUF3014)